MKSETEEEKSGFYVNIQSNFLMNESIQFSDVEV